MNKHALITALNLQVHGEGGWFRRTYCSSLRGEPYTTGQARAWMSSIFYMLSDDSPIGCLHRNRSDILHYFHGGAPLHYYIIRPDGGLEQQILGPEPARGHCFQLLVPGGCWKAAELKDGEYGLISEAVCPGFVYEDRELARAEDIKMLYPDLWPMLERFIPSRDDAAPDT